MTALITLLAMGAGISMAISLFNIILVHWDELKADLHKRKRKPKADYLEYYDAPEEVK